MLVPCPTCKRSAEIPIETKTDRLKPGVRCKHCSSKIT